MQNVIFHNIKFWTISLICILILFIALVFLFNQNTMIITMKSDSSPLRAKVYFTTEGKSFVEGNSIKNYKIKKDQYYFLVPKFVHMQYVRFDPARKEADISIEKITIIRDKWFKTRIYDVSITNIIPNNQIENFQQSNKKVSFTTMGNDPQLNIRFLYKEQSVTHNFHIGLLLIAILLFNILWYIYHNFTSKSILDIKDFSLCRT